MENNYFEDIIYSQKEMGNAFLLKKDYLNAMLNFRLAAEQGDEQSKNIYQSISLELISKLDYNNPYTLLATGMDIKYGNHFLQDYSKAFELIEKAANLGHSKSIIELADFFRYGFCCKKNVQSYYELIKPLADESNIAALHKLSICYFEGYGVQIDLQKAMSILKPLANIGYAPAENSLGFCYDYGDSVQINHSLAFKWFKKAAAQNDQNALKNIGLYYKYGKHVAVNYKIAKQYLLKSAMQGNSTAQYELAEILDNECDVYNAKRWYTASARQGNILSLEKKQIFLLKF